MVFKCIFHVHKSIWIYQLIYLFNLPTFFLQPTSVQRTNEYFSLLIDLKCSSFLETSPIFNLPRLNCLLFENTKPWLWRAILLYKINKTLQPHISLITLNYLFTFTLGWCLMCFCIYTSLSNCLWEKKHSWMKFNCEVGHVLMDQI